MSTATLTVTSLDADDPAEVEAAYQVQAIARGRRPPRSIWPASRCSTATSSIRRR